MTWMTQLTASMENRSHLLEQMEIGLSMRKLILMNTFARGPGVNLVGLPMAPTAISGKRKGSFTTMHRLRAIRREAILLCRIHKMKTFSWQIQ